LFTPVLSADGQFVIHLDIARNLVLYDRLADNYTTIATNVPPANAVMTPDGRFVVFLSPPPQGGGADANRAHNVYLYDRTSGGTELISRRDSSLAPTSGNAYSRIVPGALSANGRYLAFESFASDLVPNDTNRTSDVFVRDLITGSNTLISANALSDGPGRGPSRRPVISGDGRWAAYEAVPDDAPWAGLSSPFSLFAVDLVNKTNLLVAKVGKVSDTSSAVISENRGLLAFQSSEPGLGGVPGSGSQIYFRDLARDTNVLVSLADDGAAAGSAPGFAPAISPDGRYVAYLSGAANLVTNATAGTNVFLWDALTASNVLVSVSAAGDGLNRVFQAGFAANGSLLVFRRDSDIYLYSITNRVVLETISDAANASLSIDGRFVACERSGSYAPGDTSLATDVYLVNRTTGAVSLVSADREGTGSGNGRSFFPLVTANGRYVLFRSRASNLVADDSNRQSDLFLRDLVKGVTILVSLARNGSASGNGLSATPLMSADGSTVVFESYASDLGSGDYNQAKDIFLLRLSAGDSDGDGLPDDWELAHFNGLGRDGLGDFDGDGHTDATEFRAGTNPTDGASILRVVSLTALDSGQTTVFWSAVPGKTYRVEYKDQLDESPWSDLPGDVVPGELTGMKVDNTFGSATHRFYRVRLLP